MDSLEIEKFQQIIWDFYKKNKRSFPWRQTSNPYEILVSEFMLQQTQTARVVEKYVQFLEKFPTVTSLSKSTLSEVLSIWSGLGYNRRAKFLHQAAHIIDTQWKGLISPDPEMLDALPGVGYNTAAAICAYSFNSPVVFIETNIRRVFIHHFFTDTEEVSDKEILPLVKETLPPEKAREWYWALMDYGSALPKVVANPNRKSKHYAKQSKFKGSVRQVRGSVLKILVAKKSVSKAELRELVEGNPDLFDQALAQLAGEKFVLIQENKITLQ